MRKLAVLLVAALGATVVAALALQSGGPGAASASSHREAPLIADDPTADNTDLYAFRANDAPDALTIISNWIPGEDPAAGPNYYRFSATARYDIYLDQTGDGKPDITWRFRFQNPAAPTDSFLGTTAQTVTVTKLEDGSAERIVGTCSTPPANI